MHVPPETAWLAPKQGPLLAPPVAYPPRVDAHACPHRRDPNKNVRMFPAYDARGQAARDTYERVQHAWWESPIAIGTLLVVAPPIGLAAVWSSPRYGADARRALTIMTAFMMILVAAVLVISLAP